MNKSRGSESGDWADALGALDADTVGALLQEAIAVSSVTCSRPGADPPTAAEMRAAVTDGR